MVFGFIVLGFDYLPTLLKYTIKKMFIGRKQYFGGGVILTLIIAMLWHYIPIALPQMFGGQTLLATAFYMSGYLCRKNDMHFNHPLMTGLLLLLVPAIAACFIKLDM